jgi:hypothetical protein
MFLNPLLLLGIGAAVIPLVLHLLSRAKYSDVDWGAMMFLQGAEARQRNSSRLNQVLLLVVRGAIVGLLAVALARPVLRSTWAGAVPEGQLAAAIVLDCSASMAFDESGHTRLDAAKAAARQVLENLQPGDSACLVVAGGDDAATELEIAPTPDLRAVADHIAAARPGYRRADLAGAMERAAGKLRETGAPSRFVYIICDRQASSWREAGAAFADAWRRANQEDGAVRLFAVPVGGADAQNVTVESIELLTAPAIRGQPLDVEVRLRNHGPVQWAALPLAVRAGDRRLPPTRVNLAPESATGVRASVQFDKAGSNLLSARARSSGLAFDDRLDVAVEVVEPLNVLILSGDERDPGAGSADGAAAGSLASFRNESNFLAVALAPYKSSGKAGPDPCVVKVVPAEQWSQVQLKDFQVVVLANVERFTPAQAQSIEQFVYDGGGLLVAPGNLARADEYNAALFRGGAGVLPAELQPPTPSDGSDATALLGLRLTHPVFQFLRGRPDPLPPATIGRYFPASSRQPDAELAEYGSGDPFLIEGKSGRGRVLLVTTPLDADWSTLPLSNFYLPFVQSAVRYLAAGAVPDRNLRPGQVLEATVEGSASGRTATLNRPDGKKVELPVLRFGGRGEIRYADTDRPGTYRLVIHGAPAGADKDRAEQTLDFVVPTPRDESDLTQLTEDRWRELEQGLSLKRLDPDLGATPIAAALAGPRGGRELWAAGVVAVLLLLVAEMLIARAVSRQDS